MTHPMTINFRNIGPSDAVEAEIRRRADKLQRLNDHWQSFEVTVEAPHTNQTKGNQFQVHIDMKVPGAHLVISHDPGNSDAHDDIYVAIRDAFRAARRRLTHHIESKQHR